MRASSLHVGGGRRAAEAAAEARALPLLARGPPEFLHDLKARRQPPALEMSCPKVNWHATPAVFYKACNSFVFCEAPSTSGLRVVFQFLRAREKALREPPRSHQRSARR